MDNIYLIYGNSYRLMEQDIKSIVKDNSYTTYDLNYENIDDVLEEASLVSLFQEKRIMLIKNANMFGSSRKKDEGGESNSKKDDKLLQYLENPNPDTIIIFTLYAKIDGKKKICKIIKDKYHLIQIEDLKPKDIYTRVDKYMKSNGYKMDYDTIYYIINNSLGNYDLTMNELDKIMLYYGKGCNVSLSDVSNIVSKNIVDSNFKFIDALMNKNIKDSFKIYDDLMLQKVEPIMLLSMMAKEIKNTLLVKQMINTSSKRDIMDKLSISYEFQVDKLINNSYSFKESILEDYLLLLGDLDYKIKSGKVSNKLALQVFIMEICK